MLVDTVKGTRSSATCAAQKYLGSPYPDFGGGTRQRVLLRITPARASSPRG